MYLFCAVDRIGYLSLPFWKQTCRPFLFLFVQTSVDYTPLTLQDLHFWHWRVFLTGQAFAGQRTMTINTALTSRCGQRHRPANQVSIASSQQKQKYCSKRRLSKRISRDQLQIYRNFLGVCHSHSVKRPPVATVLVPRLNVENEVA